MDTISLTIDGLKVEAGKGATILEVAQGAGIYIPALCADPDLEPYGACRLCVVEIENKEGLSPACTTPVEEGMVVYTDTVPVNEMRRRLLELLLSDHPDNCLTCVKNQRCELQRVVAYVGIDRQRLNKLERSAPKDESNPFFYLDRSKCILCAKCVRVCREVQGVGALELVNQGFSTKVIGKDDKLIVDSGCVSCGQCVAKCPVGALVPKDFRAPTREVKTICPYCGTGCGIYLGIRGNEIVGVSGDRDSRVNRGNLCVKGRFGIVEFVHHPDRLTSPLLRRDGVFTEASWDEALDIVSGKLSDYRGDQVAVISSAKCTNESNYVMQKLARAVLGSNNVDHCARLCHAPTVAGLVQSFGSGAMTNPISEIGDAACILAIGTNTTADHPIIGLEIKRAVRKGAKLIVANPRQIDLSDFAELWLRHRVGTDVALLMGMMRVIVDEELADWSFIEERCENFDAFKKSLEVFDLDFVEQITGVSGEQIVAASRIYATHKPATILYAMGITQHSHGTDNVLSCANLAMLTGNIGKPSSGVNPLRGQNNVQGACDMGALPDVYPGYQSVADPAIGGKFEAAWDEALDLTPGLTLTEIFDAAYEGNIKAIYIVGENPILSDPNAKHVEEALKRLDFLVVQDVFLSETARLAHVVLPATTFAEEDGTFTNTERRVQRVYKAIEPVGNSRPDWWITCQIAHRMGGKGFDFDHPSQIMKEIAQLVPSYGGISYERLENGGLVWPCPSPGHPGTPILHSEAFVRGKGKFQPVGYKPSVELPDGEYPLVLTTGRSLYHFHTGTLTRKVKGLNTLRGEELCEINPKDAERLGIADGNVVRVTSRRGEVTATAKLTDASPPGVISMTFHFAESPINVLTNPALDPVAKIPELKACAVRVEKVTSA